MPLRITFASATSALSDGSAAAAVSLFAGLSSARVGDHENPAAITIAAKAPANFRRIRYVHKSVATVIEMNFDMIPTNLSRGLDWPDCDVVLQLYHMGKLLCWEK